MKRHTSPPLFFAFDRLATVAATILVIASTSTALAVTTVWSGSSAGGDFNTTGNWSAVVPGTNANDLAIFNNTTNVNGTVSFSANASHATAQMVSTAGTLTFDVGANQWLMTGPTTIGIASGTDAPTVKVISGKIQSDRITLGPVGNVRPSLELTGSTTQWHTTFTSGGAQFGLGADGATVLVHNGAKLTGVGQALIGLAGSKNSTLTISGVGSTLDFGNYIGVGHSRNATTLIEATNSKFEVLDGGYAEAGMIYMSVATGSTDNLARISGAGSIVNLIGTTPIDDGRESRVGMVGPNNELRIENGGAVTGTNTFLIGRDATSTGNKLVLNQGSLTGTGIEVRRGQLAVTGSTIDLSEWFDESTETYKGGGLLAPLISGSGTVDFNSGMISSVNANFVVVESGLAFTIGDGGAAPATYFMKKDHAGKLATHTFGNGIALASNGILAGSGNIVGNLSGAAGAIVDVGASAGLINAANNWSNTGLSLDLEVGNLATHPAVGGNAYDEIRVAGAFTHGGSVAIDVAGFVAGSGFVKDLKLIGWGSEIGSNAATGVSFVGGPALPYEFRSDGLYLTNVAYTFVPEPTALALCLLGFTLMGSTSRRCFGAKR